jgi:predicted DsbA family dithiol-disulfide isomerase
MKVTVYTDPGCPFGFNAQRQDLQLLWHYGDDIEIRRTMIVLLEEPKEYADVGWTAEQLEGGERELREQYGMPMIAVSPPRLGATFAACRLYVGARRDDPGHALPLLRALRRRRFSEGQPLDEPDTLYGAAGDVGVSRAAVDGWLADADVEAELRADMADTRSPLPEALALAHRLSGSGANLRYSTASAVFEEDGRRIVAPGFQPFAVHEVAVANLAPQIERRPPPESARELLDWAPYALATAEVAELRGIDSAKARAELEQAGASFQPSAQDGYWS